MTTFIPESLQALPCWVLWRLEHRHGRATKIPYRADGSGQRASSTDPETWCSYEQAAARLERERDKFNGLGVAIKEGSGLVFIDLDHVVDVDGTLSDFAAGVLERFPDAYVELSQSGSGLHIFCRGTVPRSFRDSHLGLEVYDSKRYAAITGNALHRCEVTCCQDGLSWLWSTYGPRTEERAAQVAAGGAAGVGGSSRKPGSSGISDADIITRLQQHGRGAALWAGDWQGAGYSSKSEADAALCTILAFWCDRDTERVERLFSASGLVRDKWTRRADYRARTIDAGCAACGETFSEWTMRKRKEEADEFRELLLRG